MHFYTLITSHSQVGDQGPFCLMKLTFFKKKVAGIPTDCVSVWIQMRVDVVLGLIWVQTI